LQAQNADREVRPELSQPGRQHNAMKKVSRVLIYRLGSLGDTVVALPSLHLIARAFPETERALLSNIPVDAKVPAAAEIVNGSGLIHRYFSYPVATRDPRVLYRLLRELRAWSPDVLVYLCPSRGAIAVLRDAAYFRLCGAGNILGLPLGELAEPIFDPETGRWEPEWRRLLRCLKPLGDIDTNNPATWDLRLTEAEIAGANQAIATFEKTAYIACSIGTKVETNDWGEANWTALFRRISGLLPGYGLVMVGATAEHRRSETLSAAWRGPRLNLCGELTPRVSAEVLSRAALFVGHDSGPMHLAALGMTPCVAVFSARNRPGQWFPHGSNHRVLYHKTECFGCGLTSCLEKAKKCILSITVDEVFDAIAATLQPGARPPGPQRAASFMELISTEEL